MFNKLSPRPITDKGHRRLLIFSMIWFFSGAWIDSSAHTYLIDDIETFFTPWHALLDFKLQQNKCLLSTWFLFYTSLSIQALETLIVLF